MKQIYPNLNNTVFKNLFRTVLLLLVLFPFSEMTAQDTFTLGAGTINSGTLGVSPFATINRNSRSQYIYYGVELQDAGAVQGTITAFALNITALASPTTLQPENVTIKFKQTLDAFGTEFATGFTTVYTANVENITQLGWHTFTLQTPFEWDGESHIIVEICRSNTNFGTNFNVEAEQYGVGDFRSIGLYTNDATIAGCNLTGDTPMSNAARRTRPNAQFTLAQICNGLPTAGTAVVSAGPYCNGTPFNISVQGSDIASGLSYQWQSAPHSGGPWVNLPGATASTYSGTQTTATYYRRQTTCDETIETANSLAVLVNGPGCYCEAPTDTANPVGITHVAFSSINTFTSSNNTYSFTDSMAQVEQTLSYTLSCNVNTSGGTNYTTAWIDWNHNGDFEASESYNLGTVTGGLNAASGLTPSITVPANAVVGTTHMRVRTQQSPANVSANACGDIVTGETEDYSIVVNEHLGIGTFNPNAANVLVYGSHNGLNIKVSGSTIQSVQVYDISGRLLAARADINNAEVVMTEIQKVHQVMVVKITTASGAVVSKKVVL